MAPEIRVLYHFTDRRNLTSIKELGGLYSWAKLQEMGAKVEVPGGNDWSHEADGFKGLDSYVHLCFRKNHPMEYSARQDGRIKESIFLEIDPGVLEADGVLFTDDVSNKAGVESYPFEQAADVLDFEVLDRVPDWNDADFKNRLRKAEKYEILVPDFVPSGLIRNL
jgi:hypothetical protein